MTTRNSANSDDKSDTVGSDGTSPFIWILVGAVYGIMLRVVFGVIPAILPLNGVMSAAFLLGTPVIIGAIAVYGKRHQHRSLWFLIFGPWAAVFLMLLGSALALLEGAICIALMAPLFLICGSAGGIIMGLILYFREPSSRQVLSLAVLPFLILVAEAFAPMMNSHVEIRDSVLINASSETVWAQILTAEDIEADELPFSISHTIGVPRPIEGINRMTPAGEIRFSRWERGVRFEGRVTERREHESIRWQYSFDAHSFPEGSMDEHVEIGGRYFSLEDTTFNLRPVPGRGTELELIAHYRVSTGVNFYALPVARLLGHDFVNTILGLYKGRSENVALQPT